MSYLSVFILFGSISFHSFHRQAIEESAKIHTSGKKSASILITGNLKEKQTPLTLPDLELWEKAIRKAFQDSNYFEEVTYNLANSKIKFEIVIQKSQNYNFLRFFNIITLGLIPNREKQNFEMKVVIRDQHGRKLADIYRDGKIYIWIQTILILALPFKPPEKAIHKLIYVMCLDMLQELKQKQII